MPITDGDNNSKNNNNDDTQERRWLKAKFSDEKLNGDMEKKSSFFSLVSGINESANITWLGQQRGAVLEFSTPEEAETVTAGIVYEPEFVDGLRFIVDYYSTEIEGAIDALSPVRVAEACVDLPSVANNFCPLITRDPKGFITFHQSGQVNLGAFEVEGVDFGIDYGFELSSIGLEGWGAIDFGLNGTKLIDFNENLSQTYSFVYFEIYSIVEARYSENIKPICRFNQTAQV